MYHVVTVKLVPGLDDGLSQPELVDEHDVTSETDAQRWVEWAYTWGLSATYAEQ
jgi:hypothetical protein